MKKICFIVVMYAISLQGFGQQLEDIVKLVNSGQNKNAKDLVDKFLSDPDNASKTDALFYKGSIYNSLSKDSTLSPLEALKLKTESFEAYKKYQQTDAKELLLILQNHGSYFDLYNGYFDIGVKAFNNKDFSLSFAGFKNALVVEDYVKSKGYDYGGFKFPAVDTSLVLNTAIAAKQANDETSAVTYYKMLTDANLSSGKDLAVYQFLVEYYLKKNDDADLTAILEKGKQLYPREDYWTDVELEKISKSGDKHALWAKYEELMKDKPAKYAYPYNLGVELFNELYTRGGKPADAGILRDKLSETLKVAISLDQGVDSRMLMVRHLYNYAYDFQDSSKNITGVTPGDIKKKNDFKQMFIEKIDECIPYGESAAAYFGALPGLTTLQKANYKDVLDILAQFYSAKGDAVKSATYQAKKEAL